ncbi:hypothetical protein GCM10023340_36360 [Nocardioides marinquilinus]|uniref:Uncharacterized protein n=1 Tax=Nocardioides marinquilinus TaxID=1210400 RepID=A0ABP9Q1K7_9ACTN
MARKPSNFQWLGFTDEQIKMLDFFDFIGNNGWARNSQSDALMPGLLKDWAEEGRTLEELQQAMQAIGYDRDDMRQLARWESKRTTGKFGR